VGPTASSGNEFYGTVAQGAGQSGIIAVFPPGLIDPAYRVKVPDDFNITEGVVELAELQACMPSSKGGLSYLVRQPMDAKAQR
jgi:hypothetical protein